MKGGAGVGEVQRSVTAVCQCKSSVTVMHSAEMEKMV